MVCRETLKDLATDFTDWPFSTNSAACGAGDDHPAHAVVEVPLGFVREAGEPGGENAPDVFGKEDQHGKLRSQLDHGGEAGAGVFAPKQLGDDAQVARGRHWQKLGEALDNRQDDHLDPGHCGGGISHGERHYPARLAIAVRDGRVARL